ncbi:MAG: transcriptional regulator, partial [Pseudomonadota bacterium]
MSVPADVTLRLNGRFRVEDASGAPLTPRGTKAQGLLALLATSPARERSRPWLQQKLWSDRSREQGSASLRAALSEIRRTFGVHADVLRADRRVVALDDRAVRVVRDGAGEFLEGIDLRDPEFLDWLRAERRADLDVPTGETDAVPRPEPGVEIHISVQDDGTPMECLLSEVFLGRVANSLREELGISV